MMDYKNKENEIAARLMGIWVTIFFISLIYVMLYNEFDFLTIEIVPFFEFTIILSTFFIVPLFIYDKLPFKIKIDVNIERKE
jgi:hypothetical protein